MMEATRKFLDGVSFAVFVLSLAAAGVCVIWGNWDATKLCFSVTFISLAIGILTVASRKK